MDRSLLGGLKDLISGRETIKIGVIASLAGPLSYYATMQTRGLKLGIKYATKGTGKVADLEIELIIDDDAGDPGYGGQKARSLIEDRGIDILQGSTSSAVTIVISKIAEEYKRLLVVEPAAADSITGEHFNRYIFRTSATTWQDAAAGGKYAVDNLGRTFAFIAPDNIWGQQSNNAWKSVIENNGGETLIEVLAPGNTQDFHPFLETIINTQPDVLVQSWAGAGNRELFSAMRDKGIFTRMRVTGGLGDREARHALGQDAVGMIGAIKYSYLLPDNPINDWLKVNHFNEYGEYPDLFTGGGFAAGVAIVEALKKTEGSSNPEDMIPVMEGMSFEAAKGRYTFRKEDHQALQPMYVVEMVSDPDQEQPWSIPKLIHDTTPEETAPPVSVKAG